jgi:hypothetical protein
MKGIVICSWIGGEKWLSNLLESLKGNEMYPICIFINGFGPSTNPIPEWLRVLPDKYPMISCPIHLNDRDGYELAAIKWAVEQTNLEEFLLLQDTMEVVDPSFLYYIFEAYSGRSVSYSGDFSSYFLKFRREALLKMEIPQNFTKVESVRNEADFISAYRAIENVDIFHPSFTDASGKEEWFLDRLNLVIRDEYMIKRKGTWKATSLFRTPLEHLILDLSHKYKLSHLSGCLTAVEMIDVAFSNMKEGDRFVLSSGHVGMALYAVLQKYKGISAEKIYLHHGVHPSRCKECGIEVSSGSLGQGLPIALGIAMAISNDVYCLISDGECSEGSIWEALAIREKYKVFNLRVYVNANGFGAYDPIDLDFLEKRLSVFTDILFVRTRTFIKNNPYLKNVDPEGKLLGQEGHYVIL